MKNLNCITGSGATVSTYVADGAISLDDKFAILDGTSATAQMTLEDGAAGQVIYIKAIEVSNACDVTPANFRDGTKVTFTPADEYAILLYDGATWNFLGGDGAIT